MSKFTERLTFANVMSVLAVFIAIGGGAYAAGLARDSVKSKQIAASAVKQSELAPNAVTADKIADGSVTNPEIANNAVNGAKVNEASLGQVPLAAVAAEAQNTLGVTVSPSGTVAAQAQPDTTSFRLALGNYTVDFGRPLGSCAAVAALGNNLGNIPNPGEIGATINFDDTVTVQTRNSSGSPTDNGFQLIVVC